MTAQWIASTTWAYEPSEVREAIARYIIRVWDGSLSRHIMSIANICEGFRTPIGRYGGALAQVRTDDLASVPLAALRDKVNVDFQPGWPHTQAQIKLTFVDGRVLEATHDSGIPEQDLQEQGRRLEAKFLSLAEPVLGARAHALAAAVASLDESASLRELTRLCAPA